MREKFIEPNAANELLAFFSHGEDVLDVIKSLINDAGYQYLSPGYIEQEFRNIFRYKDLDKQGTSFPTMDHIKEIFNNIYQSEYQRELLKAADSMRALTDIGLKKEEIIGILNKRPLRHWEKTANRIIHDREFSRESSPA